MCMNSISKQNVYNSVPVRDRCRHTQLWFRSVQLRWIKTTPNQSPCGLDLSTHFANQIKSVSRLLCCGIVTVTCFTLFIIWQKHHNVQDAEVHRFGMVLTSILNVDNWNITIPINSDTLIFSANVRGEIMFCLLITPLILCIKLGDYFTDAREFSVRSFLIHSFLHTISDTMSVTQYLWHNFSNTLSLTQSLWCNLSDTISLTQCL
jgi:hypothetical protein